MVILEVINYLYICQGQSKNIIKECELVGVPFSYQTVFKYGETALKKSSSKNEKS